MKRFLSITATFILIVGFSLMLSACNKKIDGARFTVTKSIISAAGIGAKISDETEDREKQDFNCILNITISVTINEIDGELIIDCEQFKFSSAKATKLH